MAYCFLKISISHYAHCISFSNWKIDHLSKYAVLCTFNHNDLYVTSIHH